MGKVRTFSELTAGVAKKAGISKTDAGKALTHLCDEIAETLKSGQIFRLRDIGNLRMLPKKARIARNPFSGEQFESPAGLRVKFSVGSALKVLAKEMMVAVTGKGKAEKPAPKATVVPASKQAVTKPAPAEKTKATVAKPDPKAAAAKKANTDELEELLKES